MHKNIPIISFFSRKFAIIHDKYHAVESFFVFCLMFLLFSIFFFSDTGAAFLDEHFFHFKYAYLLRTYGFEINKHFDWIYLTVQARDEILRDTTLFQLALIPFTFFKDLKIGLFFSDVFWASFTLSFVYYLLRKFKIKYAFLLILLVVVSYFSMKKLLAGRAFVFSIGLVFLLLYLAIKEKYYKFFFTSLFCILWRPAIFFMPLIIAIIAEIARLLSFRKLNPMGFLGWLVSIIIAFLYFPNTLLSLFTFFKEIAYGPALGEGVEMTKYTLFQIAEISEIFMFIVLLSFAFVFHIYLCNKKIPFKKRPDEILTIYAAFLFSLMSLSGAVLINGRFFEYYWISAIFLAGSCISYWKQKNPETNIGLNKFLFGGYVFFLFVMGTSSFINIKRVIYLNDIDPIKQAAEWVASDSSNKDKVYLYNWSTFPVAFFFNDKNIYSVGSEPMALKTYNEDLYWKWYNIFNNDIYCDLKKDCLEQKEKYISALSEADEKTKKDLQKENGKNIIDCIKNDFGAKYIISSDKIKYLFELNDELFISSFKAHSEKNDETYWAYKLK